MTDRTVRLSQTVAPFGVGAIYDLLGESFVACDTSMWASHGTPLRLPRLERELGVRSFRAAPSQAELWGHRSAGVPYVRFPRWLFCQRCRTMYRWRWNDEVEGEAARCKFDRCRNAALVPMRFVAVCPNGHLDDVPWPEWAHSKASTPEQKGCRSLNLALVRAKNASAGLESLRVHCRTCNASRSLAGIASKDSLRGLESRDPQAVRCAGTQPWQRRDAGQSCGAFLQVVQRGASNLYFATVSSALDIPPDSDFDPFSEIAQKITTHPFFGGIVSAPEGPIADTMIAGLAADVGAPERVVRDLVERHVAAEKGAPLQRDRGESGEDLHLGEWRAFLAPDREHHPRDRFVKATTHLLRETDREVLALARLGELVDTVVLATRLREVRALKEFTRYDIGGPGVAPDLGRGLDWLPAIEVYGEGIFIALKEEPLARWESESGVQALAAETERRRVRSLVASRLRPATARYLLLHTFAHLLIRQLAFECGYAAASLRERIYAATDDSGENPQAGLLIYTAAGDAEGTLGGLVGQGQAPRLASSILRALERSGWCSSDPLCRENSGQGFQALNRAACHACAHLPETSCEAGNKLLDRTFVVGGDSVPGFFQSVLDGGLTAAATTVGAAE